MDFIVTYRRLHCGPSRFGSHFTGVPRQDYPAGADGGQPNARHLAQWWPNDPHYFHQHAPLHDYRRVSSKDCHQPRGETKRLDVRQGTVLHHAGTKRLLDLEPNHPLHQ